MTTRSFDKRYSAKGTGIERVYNYYKYQSKNGQFVNVHLLNSIEKYGYDAFKIDEQFDVAYTKEELKSKEKKWISHYNSCNINYGYNKTAGGDSFLSGEQNPMYNRVEYGCDCCGKLMKLMPKEIKQGHRHYCSPECKKTGYSLFNSGENNRAYNKIAVKCDYCGKEILKVPATICKHNYCSRECKSEHQKELNLGANNPKSKKVICTTTHKVFDTSKEAAEYYHCCRQHISKNCTGKIRYCGKLEDGTKLEWRYYKDYVESRNVQANTEITAGIKELAAS